MKSTSYLAINIKYLRKKENWSQQDLAKRLKIVRSAISKWETEKEVPSVETIIELSNLFGVSVDFLVGNHYVPKNNDFNNQVKEDEEITQIVHYLIKNPKLKKGLYKHINQTNVDRKVMEDVISIIVKA